MNSMSKRQNSLFLPESIITLADEISNTFEKDLMKFTIPVNEMEINSETHSEKRYAFRDWRQKICHELMGAMISLEEELKHNIETFGLPEETISITEDAKTPLESLLTDVILERAKLLPSNILNKILEFFSMQLQRFADLDRMKLKGNEKSSTGVNNEKEFDAKFAIALQKWKMSFIKKFHKFMIGIGVDIIKTLMPESGEGIIAKLAEEIELSSEMSLFNIMLDQIRAEYIIESFSQMFETKFLKASGTEDSIISMDSDTTSLDLLANIAIYAQWKNKATEKLKHIMVNLAIDFLRVIAPDNTVHKKKSKFSSEALSLFCTDLAELKQRASEKSTEIWLDFENELLQVYSQMKAPETEQLETQIKTIRKQISPWISEGINKMKEIVNSFDRAITNHFYRTRTQKSDRDMIFNK
ncbi:hypothetical protein TNCT_530871 [Trichonephila clavata]|uniref:Uncharacterized protein n=1 Tax=Trichonephila clavata TaxID=2740835 RepID=A0A8X6L343_TRICU|nr:hypothetical protein TNCT_530871 [Trichonephila clavata]